MVGCGCTWSDHPKERRKTASVVVVYPLVWQTLWAATSYIHSTVNNGALLLWITAPHGDAGGWNLSTCWGAYGASERMEREKNNLKMTWKRCWVNSTQVAGMHVMILSYLLSYVCQQIFYRNISRYVYIMTLLYTTTLYVQYRSVPYVFLSRIHTYNNTRIYIYTYIHV